MLEKRKSAQDAVDVATKRIKLEDRKDS